MKMPLMYATPSKGKPHHDAAHHIRTPHPQNPHESYHVGHYRHVDRPYDKHSKLYHPDLWNWHDLYDKQVSYASVVTRSQTAFNRIEMDKTHVVLFGDKALHQPPDLPHLVMTMKDGTYGAIPRTIVTRSCVENIEINPTLCKVAYVYKSLVPLELSIREKQSRKPSLLKRILSGKESTAKEVKVQIKIENMNGGGENEEINEYLPNRNLAKASLTMDGSARFNEHPVQGTDPASSWRNTPLESSFPLESLKNRSQPKACSLGVLKAPSFSVTPNSLSDTFGDTLEEGSQSRREEDQREKEKVNESFLHQTLTEASPTRVGSVRYNEQHGANPALSVKNTPLIRESSFPQKFLKNLSQSNALGVFKAPSFSVTPNYLSIPSLEVNTQSRREDQNRVLLPSVSLRGLKRLRLPPYSRDFLKNRIKSPTQLPIMQTTF